MQSSIVVTPVVATESVIAAAVQSEPVPLVTPTQQAADQSLPAELADLDLTKLSEEDLAVLAEDFQLDLAWLKKQQRLAAIKNKSRTTS